jgi:hypothetical protein
MGQIVKQISETTTRYYWYPGDKKEWIRSAVAIGAGAVSFAVVGALVHGVLVAVVCGTSVTAAVAGVNFGRRDARALAGFPDLSEKAARRAAIVHTGRAAWRAIVEGLAAASAAVLIVNLPARGLLADWLLPLVPATIGGLAHQAGMLYERTGHTSPRASSLRPAGLGATAAR